MWYAYIGGTTRQKDKIFHMEYISDHYGVLFSDHRIQRVVVEPDVRNEKVHKLNRKAGFTRYKNTTTEKKHIWSFAPENNLKRSTKSNNMKQIISPEKQ